MNLLTSIFSKLSEIFCNQMVKNFTRSVKLTKIKQVPRNLINWDFFKRNLLDKEDNRKSLKNTEYNEDEFKVVVKRLLRNHYPSHCNSKP